MTEKLSPNFLNELFRTAFRNKSIFDILVKYLEFHYLPTEEYKEIWKTSKLHFDLHNELPTIGIIAEQHKDKQKLLLQLDQIKKADIISNSSLIVQVESFLRDIKFIDLYNTIGELRKQGNKDGAIKALQKGTDDISNFSLQAEQFTKVYRDFETRYRKLALENVSNASKTFKKAIWGIDSLDNRHHGGVDYGDTATIIALSNVGKTPMLKHIGYSNSRIGKNVLHIQAEGTKLECEQGYWGMLSAHPLIDIETTSLPENILEELYKSVTKVTGEVDIVAYEKFGTVTMSDIEASINEYLKTNPALDVIILDYIDKVEPSNGKKYSTNMEGEKARRAALADAFKNLCMQFNVAGFTATQASDISEKDRSDPNFKLTRSNIRGDKNFLDPFSYGVTLNQTFDEKKNETMRLWEEKCRKYGYGYMHHISTAYANSRFYDRKRTINLFGE
jgi:hypothetical protein